MPHGEEAVTDGERLVWAASFTRALDRAGDAVVAADVAARTIVKLREAAERRLPDGDYAVPYDARHFLDEIVNVP